MGSELGQRVLAALVLAPVAIGAAWYGDWALAGLLSVAAALASVEFYRIARGAGILPMERLGVPMASVVPLIVHASRLGIFSLSPAGAAVAFLVIFAATIWARGAAGRPLAAMAVTAAGVVYTGGMLSFAYSLRYHPYTVEPVAGAAVLLFPLILTWTTDTGAYFVGRRLGRHKLIPSVSPGKSVEGAVGGLVTAMAVAWLYERYVLAPSAHFVLMPGAVLFFGAAVSIAAQTGDLAESLIKREAGVKDASRLIPGHGGVLDRLDSLLFALPVAAWLLHVLRLIPVPQ